MLNKTVIAPELAVNAVGNVDPLNDPSSGDDAEGPSYTLTKSYPLSVLNELNEREIGSWLRIAHSNRMLLPYAVGPSLIVPVQPCSARTRDHGVVWHHPHRKTVLCQAHRAIQVGRVVGMYITVAHMFRRYRAPAPVSALSAHSSPSRWADPAAPQHGNHSRPFL